MLAEYSCEKISKDWLWRERELRYIDAMLIKGKETDIKTGILFIYAHWEGHFKFCASELLYFMSNGIDRKLFKWTDVHPEIRQRLLFCGYRKRSIPTQSQETFILYLNALHDARFSQILNAKSEIIMIDDNLSSSRAEAICRNLGVDYAWCALKKVIIDERLLAHRNAIAHGSNRLQSGDELDLSNPLLIEALGEVRSLIRETKNQFANAILQRLFLA